MERESNIELLRILAMLAIGEAGSVRNVIQGCVPFFGRSVWFASAYISLMALTPFLNRILEWPRPVLSRLVPFSGESRPQSIGL